MLEMHRLSGTVQIWFVHCHLHSPQGGLQDDYDLLLSDKMLF